MNISSISAHIAAPIELASPQPVNQDRRVLIQAVKAINAAELFGQDNELSLGLDPYTRNPVARLVNRETREEVQQMPSEDVLRLAEQLKER